MAEETKNPAKNIPIRLVGSMMFIIGAYCLLAVTLCLKQPSSNIDANAPFSVGFQASMGWAKYIVAAGALKGVIMVSLISADGQARYLTHIARTHVMPPFLAKVNEKTSAPVNAAVAMLLTTATIAFFTSLDVLSNLLSISTLFLFMLVAVVLLVHRHYVSGERMTGDCNKLISFLVTVLVSLASTAIYWANSDEGWVGYAATVPIWFLATLGLSLTVPQTRKPKLCGTPLVPWLPSLSIAINFFHMGSIDEASFLRFWTWTAFLLICKGVRKESRE